MAGTKYVRLKPYDPRRRHLLRSFMHGPSNQRFEEKRGWYVVPDPLAKYLSAVHQIESDPDSPLAFDVCTLEEAKAIDAREKKTAEKRAAAGEANDLTTNELGENRRRAADLADGGALAPARAAVAARKSVPAAQRSIRRGVRDPRDRSMRPATEDEIA